MRRLAAATVGMALVALAIPVFAAGQGQTVEIDGALKIRNRAPAFHGRVTADNDACAIQREVKLFKRHRTGGRKLLATGISETNGHWEIPIDPLKSGIYFATAPRREEGTAGTIYACVRLKSRTLVVD